MIKLVVKLDLSTSAVVTYNDLWRAVASKHSTWIVKSNSFILQEAVIENRALWMMIKRCFGYQSKSQYRIWQRDLAGDPSWPPLNQTSHSDMPECGRGVSYSNPVFESNEEQL